MAIFEKLSKIQSELKAPKNQYNSFGKYKYRSCEDILEAVKPICQKNGCALILSDEVVNLDGRYYVKATATLIDGEDKISNSAFAREDESKKGMDGSQITGTASSYARKYALNGLFCIDDTKDADTNENAQERQSRAQKDNPIICPKCGKAVKSIKGKDGKTRTPEQVLAQLNMCADCYKQEKSNEQTDVQT
ncbi:MAG: ERF family protein [Acutalibacteraceae bacterium]|nr:ERF family protein [Acutalibacteraceae bacterium]